MKDDIKNTTIRVYLFCLRQIYRYEGEKNLPRLDLPALIIHGSADSIIPAENIKRASGLIRECKVRLLAGANHLLILNNSEQVSEEIDGFIKTHLVTSETNLTPIKIGT
jgi:pimeloyl-ACP methyl ester carboxylesterase